MNANRRQLATGAVATPLLLLTLVAAARRDDGHRPSGVPLPPFTQSAPEAWINSRPLTLDDLRGQVLLVDVWTYECWNCYRSFPWLKQLEARFANDAFTVVGIHSPEFEHEHDIERVRAKVREFGLHHPVMVDNDFGYWRALGNRYWPAFYLVDKQGLVRYVFVGETHAGDSQARRIQNAIAGLLKEPAAPGEP